MERSLKWVEQKEYNRFGCTECTWTHPNPSLRDDPTTLDTVVFNFIQRVFEEHSCSHYSAARRGSIETAETVWIVEAAPARSWVERLVEGSSVRKVFASEYRPAAAP